MRCLLSRRCLVFGLSVFLACFCSGPIQGKSLPDIEIKLDTAYIFGNQPARMAVHLANYFDTLAGIQIHFRLDRPSVCSLLTVVDTAGTLLSGWPHVELKHIGSSPYNVNLIALAAIAPGNFHDPLPPQFGEIPLLYLVLQPLDNLDTLFDTEAFVDVVTTPATLFGLSNPNGQLVGTIPTEVLDTLYFRCQQYAGDVCLVWEQVSSPPFDSMAMVLDTVAVLDTALVRITQRGYVDVTQWVCGDFNGDQAVNLTDVTLLVNFLFAAGSPPTRVAAMDVAKACGLQLNLTDLTLLVNYLFLSGPRLMCCPHE